MEMKNWPEECFGAESILEFKGTNTTFARGAFGEISLAVYRDTTASADAGAHQRWIAVKTIAQATTTSGIKQQQQQQQRHLHPDVAQELQALSSLCSHPNIVSLLALYCPSSSASSMPGTLCLAFEYCPTDLHVTLEWRRRSMLPLLSVDVIQMIAQDLFAALCHCHSHDWVHGDIKPGNLLVSSAGIVKLCDFGLTRRIPVHDPNADNHTTNNNSSDEDMPRGLCTLAYRPPELLLSSSTAVSHAAAGDLWSAGVVLAELVTGKTLFPGINDLSQVSLLVQRLGTPSERFLETLPPHCQQLLGSSSSSSGSTSTNDNNSNHVPAPDWAHHVLPRAVETPALLDVLQNGLLVWDPRQRAVNAPVTVQQYTWLLREDKEDPPRQLLRRQQLLEQVLPPALDEPFLLLPPHDHHASQPSTTGSALTTIVQRQAMAMAQTRRTFLRDLIVWQEQ